jgi:hypothetical protein
MTTEVPARRGCMVFVLTAFGTIARDIDCHARAAVSVRRLDSHRGVDDNM